MYVSVSSEKSTIMPTEAMSEQHSNKSMITNAPLSEKNQTKPDKQILWIYYITFCTFRQRIAWNYLYLCDICTQGCNGYRNTKKEREFLLTLPKYDFVKQMNAPLLII